MHAPRRCRLPLAMLAAFAVYGSLPADAADDLIEVGRRIYEEGVLPDGAPLSYRGAAGAEMSGRQAACTQCHRRSGMGGREGRYLVPPIDGPTLFAKPRALWPQRPGRPAREVIPLRHQSRAAYDDALLRRAVGEGLDSSGRPLDALMPRYSIDDGAGAALTAYLRQLSATPPAGIEGRTLHLATIVAPDADPARQRRVIETLQAWSDFGGFVGMGTQLHVWRLEGPPEGWSGQLEGFYRARPVYAVLSGAGGSRWEAVHRFCERTALPCLFPVLDRAPAEAGFYSMYLSAGVSLEAQILARHLAGTDAPAIVQIHGDEAGAAAAQELAAALPERTRLRRFDAADPLAAAAGLAADTVVVAWLRPEQLGRLAGSLPDGPPGAAWLLSAELAPPDRTTLPLLWRGRTQWVSSRSDPQRLHGRTVLGLTPWLDRLGLRLADEVTQSDIYAAVFFFGDALARMRGRTHREFLLETLETVVDNRPAGASYYQLTLGPGQRLAAKSGHLLGFRPPAFEALAPLGPRIVPQ